MALMRQNELATYDAARFGPLPSTGIPYDRAAGAPGVRFKRTPAAVLVPLVARPGNQAAFDVILTMRPQQMKQHAGQVAFPGGRMEPDDASPEACALREAEEEIGLPGAAVEVLGRLDPYLTITGYEVTPVVGMIAQPVPLRPDPNEVAEVFDVPLDFLLDPANHRREQREYNGLTRAYYAVPYGQRYIWGATAGMILNLYELLKD
ncbi:MAG: CoA pyrophosphatase [Rhodospirillaceae bacterium]|nr:CoA pyrophosphatase [Rhodospirillaceae bacterium]